MNSLLLYKDFIISDVDESTFRFVYRVKIQKKLPKVKLQRCDAIVVKEVTKMDRAKYIYILSIIRNWLSAEIKSWDDRWRSAMGQSDYSSVASWLYYVITGTFNAHRMIRVTAHERNVNNATDELSLLHSSYIKYTVFSDFQILLLFLTLMWLTFRQQHLFQ